MVSFKLSKLYFKNAWHPIPWLIGFKYGTKHCCGIGGHYNFSSQVFFTQRNKLNGTIVTASTLSDPSIYVSWDGVHNTDAANIYIANEILSGKYFQPPFPLSTLCDLQPIGWTSGEKQALYTMEKM